MTDPETSPELEEAPKGSRPEPPDALAYAVAIHQRGHAKDASEIYEKILELVPDHADALHFLGVAKHKLGFPDEAVDLIRRSLAIAPDNASAENNLGNILRQRGRLGEAADAYRRSLDLSPENPDALSNLGTIVRAEGDLGAAAKFFQRALEVSQDHVEALHNLGNTFLLAGANEPGLAMFKRALAVRPHDGNSYRRIGAAYYSLGQVDEATQIYRMWLELQPTNVEALHLMSACSGEGVPGRASDEYVKTTFDRFADSFDEVLHRLEYRAPELVANAVGAAFGAPANALRVLDAGCGTGLGGPLLRPYARHLAGVDLSERMLAAARERKIYDALTQDELTAFLETHPSSYDLVVSIDTLVYFGDLTRVSRAFATALSPGGRVIFTVERADGAEALQGFCLNPHGRFAQTEDYVRRVLTDAGLLVETISRCELRKEVNKPVAGLVAVAARRRSTTGHDHQNDPSTTTPGKPVEPSSGRTFQASRPGARPASW
ncbi:MAG TPA: tetratricopeptide repeat protein [Polyangiaceae bacterium]|nr:tetratricopeptide repeat protein [Polyangiaceae bacterium]